MGMLAISEEELIARWIYSNIQSMKTKKKKVKITVYKNDANLKN
jgi:hypothetical protein